MELKPGYKQTEIGVIPVDWKVSTLGESSKRITDGEHATPKRSSSGYYLLSARNILNGRIDLSDVDYVGTDEYRRIRQRCNPEPGDVLISCSGTVGRVAVVPNWCGRDPRGVCPNVAFAEERSERTNAPGLRLCRASSLHFAS